MSRNLDQYLPEFDEDEARKRLAGLGEQELLEKLIYEYKLKRVLAKMLAAELDKLRRIERIVDEPSKLAAMPGVPSADDLRRMMGDE